MPQLNASALDRTPKFTYEGLQKEYTDFSHPRAKVRLGDKEFDSIGKGMIINDIHVELTAGYEASVASFRIYDVYDASRGEFRYDEISKQVVMGNSTEIRMGYIDKIKTVFKGFITGVAFAFETGGLPYIEVTAMDVKGVMMGGSYAKSMSEKTYGAAVKKIFEMSAGGELLSLGGSEIDATPDEKNAGVGGEDRSSPITVEMVGESDYEFVVRAAKRFNYEFFVECGRVIFRPAKKDQSILIKMGSRTGLRNFNIQYSITGVVGKIEARAMDAGEGKVISASCNFTNDISVGREAKKLVGKGAKVYLDASITSAQDAESRVAALMEKMSYRLGSLEADCVGMPELLPGHFMEVDGMGAPVDNQFYISTVTHDFTSESGFATHITGCTAKVVKPNPAAKAADAVQEVREDAESNAPNAANAAGMAGGAGAAMGVGSGVVSGSAGIGSKVAGGFAVAGMAAATAAPVVAAAAAAGALSASDDEEA